jgi:hypothetical protein
VKLRVEVGVILKSGVWSVDEKKEAAYPADWARRLTIDIWRDTPWKSLQEPGL